ncbi:MAG: hypothetical protein GX638_11985 [Crenarchaeota archaeon]|nr:hypothetical protein [Thermoproteota archaeon]
MSNNSNINPLSFFEDFFSEGFNEKYDDFLHFDKKNLDSDAEESLEAIRLYDEEIRNSLSKAKNTNDVAAIMDYYSSNSPSCPNASPDTIKVVDYDQNKDIIDYSDQCDQVIPLEIDHPLYR